MGRISFFVWLLVVVWLSLNSSPAIASPEETKPALPEFEDVPSVLQPQRPRTEAEEDRLIAAAQFAHGRLLLQREDYAGALRRYERAYRYDPQAVSLLPDIVTLAVSLKRGGEAARYAVIAAERDPRDPLLMQRLAIHLTDQQEYDRALSLYEKSLELEDKPAEGNVALVRMEMGRLYFLTGKFEKSAESFAVVRDALADPQRFGLDDAAQKTLLGQAERTYSLIGECFLRAGRLDDAAEMFQKANDQEPNSGLLSFQTARIEAKRGNTESALAHLEKYLDARLSVAGTEPYELLAELVAKTQADKQLAAAALRTRLEAAYALDRTNLALGYFLANQLREHEKLDAARTMYEQLINERPTIDGYQGLIDVARREGNAESLLDALGRAVAKIGSLRPLGAEAEEIQQDAELVGRLLQAARQRREKDAAKMGDGVALAAALLAVADKKYDLADEFFAAALLTSEPDKQAVLVTAGLEFLRVDEYARSAQVFQRGLDDKVLSDDNADYFFYLSGALAMAGQTDEALRAAKRAADLEPTSARTRSRLPWIMYRAKRFPDAEKNYRDLLGEFDSNHESDEVRDVVREMRSSLSNLCVEQGRLPEAEEWLEQILDEFPDNVGAMNDLGYLWIDQGKHFRRALQMVQIAVAAEPDNIAYRDSLGWAYYRLGRYDEAILELEQATAGDDPDAVILDHLGDAYAGAGKPAQAKETWQRAVEAFRKSDVTDKLQAVELKIKKQATE